jgi:hypothetical protein
MKSKTLKLINGYLKIIKEQGEMPDMSQEQPPAPQEDAQAAPEAPEQETMPLSSAGEDKYISDMIDAALFEPSPEQANTLLNLQSQMQMKKYSNAREEILPSVLGIISASTSGGDLRKQLNKI